MAATACATADAGGALRQDTCQCPYMARTMFVVARCVWPGGVPAAAALLGARADRRRAARKSYRHECYPDHTGHTMSAHAG